MKLPEILKPDEAAERGVKMGLILVTAMVAIFEHSDIPLAPVINQGLLPYGYLWYLMNGMQLATTQLPYRIYVTAIVYIMAVVNWQFVKRGKMTKFMFYLGWLVSAAWISGGVYQNVTVTMFAPLISVFPWLVVVPILEKLPLGWSWNITGNLHWQCAFNGWQPGTDISVVNQMEYAFGHWWNVTGLMCTEPSVRWNPAYPFFYSYVIIIFMTVYPLLLWDQSHNWRVARRAILAGEIIYWTIKCKIAMFKFFVMGKGKLEQDHTELPSGKGRKKDETQ